MNLTRRSVAAPMFLGAATLAIGAAYYLAVRPQAVAAGLASFDKQGSVVAALTLGSLPTFLHVLAFSLFGGALSAPFASNRAWVCIAWVGVNALFEVGQHAAVVRVLATHAHDWCGHINACARTGQYFSRGTFDFTDIAAGALGGLVAYTILNSRDRRAEYLS